MTRAWVDEPGVVRLPGGGSVRGRRLGDAAVPADFALVLAAGPAPSWPHRRVRWSDFWVPRDTADALDALHEARRRAAAGERVEVACGGGVGRTGTALAALAVLDGLTPDDAVAWVRREYHPRAVETPWQRRWLRRVR
ncbi:protein-tyrosine phosphatase family protein [Blastococcus haudaquaticus]|uniref:protein-tyrosine phosphatase family protein n=1 Tax=Blastococcus haudaquaticus TaxID=1938745 RepID=UPI001F208537|nr:protein-tyrosine phosphatase family protein [Blastococcus haudaquaticus]